MIEVRQLEVVFAPGTPLEHRALAGLDLAIPKGQFVSVIGSNGAGKSTLLNALAGTVPVTHGRILVEGADLTRLPAASRAAAIARVFQDPLAGSCESLTLAENMALAAARGRRRGLALALQPARRDRWRAQLADLGLGLERRLDDRMGLLSGGQRQAASLLMATLAPLKILLLDEHTAALDPRTADVIMTLTAQLVATHRLTTLMITHSMRQALAVGDRLLMLHEGRIVLDKAGPAKAGLTVGALLDAFAHHRRLDPLDDDRLLLA